MSHSTTWNSADQFETFRFIQDYVYDSIFQEDRIRRVLDEYGRHIERESNNNPLNSLYNHWWEQEDGEVEKEIKEVSDGINDSKYTSSDYKRILSVFCTLKEKGFDIDVGSTLDTMKGRIKSGDRILSSQFENFDPEEKGQAYQKYREAVMELEHSLGNAESDATTNYLEKLISEKNWGLGFSSYFRMKQNDLQPDTGFCHGQIWHIVGMHWVRRPEGFQ